MLDIWKNVKENWYRKAAEEEGECDIAAGPAEVPAEESNQDGSLYKVPLTAIVNITPHPKADRLEVAWVYGFQVIVRKGQYEVGDKVIYVPIDSILPEWLESKLFVPRYDENGKRIDIYLHNSRVRQIRIRGLASQGMLVNPNDVATKVNVTYLDLEYNLSTILGITKYEPPQPGFAFTQGQPKNRNKKHEHPLFHKYNGLDNIKWFPDFFKEGEEVVIQEKMHGTNARASSLPFMANTLMKKVKKLLGLAPKFENCYGSNNVDITATTSYKGFYGEDIYGKCFNAMNVFDKLKVGEIVYGEIVGPNIQKNYHYGLSNHHFVVFDVKILQSDNKFKWLNPDNVAKFCTERNFEHVPILYKGPYNKELAYSMTKGPSLYDDKTKVREGIVIKAAEDYDTGGNKKALKWVSEDYLADSKNTDFH